MKARWQWTLAAVLSYGANAVAQSPTVPGGAPAAKPQPAAPQAPAPQAAAPQPAAPKQEAVEPKAPEPEAGATAKPQATLEPRSAKPVTGADPVATPGAKPPVAGPAPAARPAPQAEPEAPLHSLLALHVFLDTVWNTDPGYHVFSEDDTGTRLGLMAEVDVLEVGPNVALALGLGFSNEDETESSSSLNLATDANLEAQHVQAGAQVRWSPWPWLSAHARAHGGLSFTLLELQRGEAGSIQDEYATPFLGLGAGFSLGSPPKRLDAQRRHFNSIAFGARVEGGYLISSKLGLAFPDVDAEPPEQRLSVRGADLGSLDRTGAFVQVSVFARF